jgi:hypothetical protein
MPDSTILPITSTELDAGPIVHMTFVFFTLPFPYFFTAKQKKKDLNLFKFYLLIDINQERYIIIEYSGEHVQ